MPKPIFYATTPKDIAAEGLSEEIQPWEDGLRADTGRGSFEWWYFDAHFDDGSTAVIVYLTKPLLARKGPLKPGLSLTITGPDGKKRVAFPLFSPEEFSASKETCDVHIASNRVRGDLHRYELHAEAEGLAADLVFTGIVPPWRPGAGKSYFGDREHYFAWLPAIPYGRVEGTLTYDGQARHVSGTGYHDHNWGNLGLDTVMDHWYWGRAHVGDFTLIFVEQIAAKAYGAQRLPVFMLAKGDQIITGDGHPLRMATREFVQHADGRQYPREVDFTWKHAANEVVIRLRQPEILEAVSLLTFFPPWKQKILRLFANPYYFRFNAEMELRIDLEDIHTVERGNALYEIMMLK
ncbi:MAG: hypothetical protein GXP40_09635 [Chloroflexi bacterium]|nr:hypothetical protein [Chloroflexota bacterium]